MGLVSAAVAIFVGLGWVITGGSWVVGVSGRGVNALVVAVVLGAFAAVSLRAARERTGKSLEES